MKDNSFYVTLVSNVPGAKNNSAVFTTQLAEPLFLNSGEWTVGVHEVIIPTSYSMRRENWNFRVFYKDGKNKLYNTDDVDLTGIEKMTTELNKLNPDVQFGQPQTKIEITLSDKVLHLQLSREFAYYLGFKDITLKSPVNKAFYKIDINNNHSSIFVYSDVCTASHLGNTKSNVLRVLPAIGKNVEGMLWKTYDFPRYLPVKHDVVQSIKIFLADEFGRPLAFEYGHTIVVLHFKSRTH